VKKKRQGNKRKVPQSRKAGKKKEKDKTGGNSTRHTGRLGKRKLGLFLRNPLERKGSGTCKDGAGSHRQRGQKRKKKERDLIKGGPGVTKLGVVVLKGGKKKGYKKTFLPRTNNDLKRRESGRETKKTS